MHRFVACLSSDSRGDWAEVTRRLLLITLVAAGATPPAAQAATVLDTRVSASGAAAAPCQQALRRGAPGVVTRPVLVPGAGQVTVRLEGERGDWDVAPFDSGGRQIAAAASPDAQEISSGWVLERSTVTVQACRRSGTAARLRSPSRTHRSRVTRPRRRRTHRSSSRSPRPRADKDRLVALGLDMTEHGGKAALGVVLHGARDEQALRAAGFTWRVLTRTWWPRACARWPPPPSRPRSQVVARATAPSRTTRPSSRRSRRRIRASCG